MTCCFFQRKISNKQQKLIPKGLIRIFQISLCTGIKVFFAQTFRPNLCHVATPSFFLRTNLGTGAVREDIPAGCHLETKMALWKHSMAVYLRKAFFTHIEREQQKNARHTLFSPWLFGWYRVWKKFPQWILGIICFILVPFFQILSDPLVRVPSWLMQRILCSMARDNRQTVKLSVVSVVESSTYNPPKK